MSTVSYAHNSESIQKFVIEQLEAIGVDGDGISLDDTLNDLGLDSLDVVELSQSVKKNLGIAVNPKDFVDAVTVSDVLAVVRQRAGIE